MHYLQYFLWWLISRTAAIKLRRQSENVIQISCLVGAVLCRVGAVLSSRVKGYVNPVTENMLFSQ